MSKKMREWIEHNFAAQIRAWAEPTDDGMVFEALAANGSVVRADSVPLLIAALAECEPQDATPLLLVA